MSSAGQSETEASGESASTGEDGTATGYTWRSKTLAELVDFYWDEIAPAMRADDLDPELRYPTYEWLADNGFRGLEDALRTQHTLTVREFFTDRLDYDHPSMVQETEYDWGFDHDRTKQELEKYLDWQQQKFDRAESTIASKRARLAKYARVYERLHGTSDLLRPTAGAETDEYRSPKTIAHGRAVEAFNEIESSLSTKRSCRMYHNEVKQFYDRLQRWGFVEFNPVADVPEDFDWETSEPDNAALFPADVRSLATEADSLEETLLVIGLAGWGLRPNEVAALHESQLYNLDSDGDSGDDTTAGMRADSTDDEGEEWPYIEFDDERKNGPGTVSILFGEETLRQRRTELATDDDWNGYLFPSALSTSGHISTRTVQNRFKRLAERAGVRIEGEVAKPKMGRRFWYTTYQDVMSEVFERLDVVAEEQGSASADVVNENYLSEAARRRMRRDLMHEALKDAFEPAD